MKVYEFLSRERWIQGDLAEDVRGKSCDPTHKKACKWCFYGALLYCYRDHRDFRVVYEKLKNIFKGGYVSEFNDSHTYEEVIAIAKELEI